MMIIQIQLLPAHNNPSCITQYVVLNGTGACDVLQLESC